jgi:anthranilate/para-aminobenzoate synthase component I
MTTLTIKINERSKKGKAFLEFAKTFFADEKEVKIIESDSKKKLEKTIYSKQFTKKIKKAEENIKNGDVITLNPNDIWGSLGLK